MSIMRLDCSRVSLIAPAAIGMVRVDAFGDAVQQLREVKWFGKPSVDTELVERPQRVADQTVRDNQDRDSGRKCVDLRLARNFHPSVTGITRSRITASTLAAR